MAYDPKFWYPDEEALDDLCQEVRERTDEALEAGFERLSETITMMIDKNVCDAVQDHVKEGLLWIVYEDGEPFIEFTAFLGEGREDEPKWPEKSQDLRSLFQEALANCDDDREGKSAVLWRTLIKAYDDWKAS